MTTVAAILVLAYLVGGIPWSLLVVRWRRGIDLRRLGSGNLGATNAYRAIGLRGAVVVLALDVAKGVVAPLLVARLRLEADVPAERALPLLAGMAAILGHLFPIYVRFRGGKGIATTAGVFLGLEPQATGWAAAAFLVGALATRGIVSVGSLAGSLALPLAIWAVGARHAAVRWEHLGAAAALTVLIWVRHAANLQRLARGEEKRLFGRAAATRGGAAT
jgi:glycerol-3-phosphate acyltransferase PlsY